MKKSIIILTAILYLITCIPAFASANFDTCRINLVQDVDDITGIITQHISISGTTDEELYNNIITIGIIEEGLDKSKASDYQIVKQLVADESGNYSINIPFQSGGNYIVRISSEKSSEPAEFALTTASADTINEFMYGIKNEYDKSELNSAILSKGEELGFDLSIYTGLSAKKQEEICDAVLSDAASASMEEIKEAVSENCSVMAVSAQNDTELVLDTIEHYKDIYSFGTDAEYIMFSEGNETLKNYVAQNLGKRTMTNPSEVKSTLYEYTVLYDMYDIEIESQMINKIIKYSSYVNNAEYTAFDGMSLAKQTNVAGYLYDNKADSMADFNTKLNYVITNYDKLYPSAANKKPSSSGGGGGGGSTIVNIPVDTTPVIPGNTPVSVTVSFDDLKDAEWAKEAVLYLLDNKVVNGKETGKFYPNDNVTRAEFVKMLMLGCKITADNIVKKYFSDVPSSHWAYEYVNIASSRGLINGISESEFGADNYITREDMATLGYRILSYFGDITGGQSLENNFIDFPSFSDYAKNGIMMLNNHGYINGYPDGSFKPKNNVTRAEAAQFIYNLIEKRG